MSDVEVLIERIRAFSAARDWVQFHTPRSLTLALSGEVGELAAEMQWRTDAEITSSARSQDSSLDRISDEMADIFIYLLRLADVLGIDLLSEAHAKIDRNRTRYPEHLAHGSSEKYNRLPDTQE